MKSKIESKYYDLNNSEFYNVLKNITSSEDFDNIKNGSDFLQKYENYLDILKNENQVFLY